MILTLKIYISSNTIYREVYINEKYVIFDSSNLAFNVWKLPYILNNKELCLHLYEYSINSHYDYDRFF